MKSKLIIMAALCAIAFTANAQTKGTNALSFGFGSTKSEYKHSNGTSSSESTQKNNSVSLGYGFFFKDNEKIGVNLTYGFYEQEGSSNTVQNMKTYGGNLSYQKYYPIVKKLYAYAGGQAGYASGKETQSQANSHRTTNEYTAGAFGGISWFASKRFAFETNILSANLAYYESKQDYTYGAGNIEHQETKNTSFGVSSQGVFNNLGFKIYVLF